MIETKRNRIQKPGFFASEEYEGFVDELHRFYRAGGTRAQQKHFPWRKILETFMPPTMKALAELFRGKCAYSEVRLEPENRNLLLHRPSGDALGIDGDVSPDHYWWLISEWQNWYPASRQVVSAKKTQFPVIGARSAVPAKRPPYRVRERSLLLDPCRDQPVWHLDFLKNGQVWVRDLEGFRTGSAKHFRDRGGLPGVWTIRVLGLNDSELVAARRRAATQANRELRYLLRGKLPESGLPGGDGSLFLVEGLPNREFAATVRCAWAESVLQALSSGPLELSDESWDGLGQVVKEILPELAARILGGRLPASTRFDPYARRLLRPVQDLVEDRFPGQRMLERYLEVLRGRPSMVTAKEMSGGPKNMGEAPTESSGGEPAPSTDDAVEPVHQGPVVLRSATIKSVVLRNFKAIREMELPSTIGAESGTKLDPRDVGPTVQLEPAYGSRQEETISDAQRWWTLLGENGCGKSSILQAIGLGLAGKRIADVMRESGLEWQALLRRPPAGSTERVKQGRICIEFSDGTRIDLRFNRNRCWWVGGAPDMQAFVRGYGATRLLAAGYEPSKRDNVRVSNLFDPRSAVTDAKSWLLQLAVPDFNVVAPAISRLLKDDSFSVATQTSAETAGSESSESLVLTRDVDADDVVVDGLPLELASDGYRAIIAMVCDIMSGLGEGLSSMRHATGMVLIDEIGSHLHPRWRMAVTPKLRRMLPQVQFLVSTHEPLCLRGLFEREVTRIRKHPQWGVYAEVVERSPSSYRVDQLLTSEFFGLDTTIEPDLERRFHHYYRLLALSERTEDEEALLNDLYRYLQKHARPSLGYTRRDQLLYDQVDRFLAEEYGVSDQESSREEFLKSRTELRRKALAKVRDIWERRSALSDLRSE